MYSTSLDDIIKNFFTCNREELLRIFQELLSTIEAEDKIATYEVMSRNYETIHSNPEIKMSPGNLKDARDSIFPFFWGTDDWNSRLHLENVRGPANYASLIGAIACLLKNPNLCVDTYSQRSNELELKAIMTLANLVFYHTENPWGVFTMGGTISNLYGGKIGIEKVIPDAMTKGIHGKRIAGIVSEAAHYSNETLAGWLGIGTEHLKRIPTDESCGMDAGRLKEEIENLYKSKIPVAFVIATFGTTDAFGIDNIRDIRKVIDELSEKYKMPKPHLHADAAVGWTLCLLNEYDAKKNLFRLKADTLEALAQNRKRAMEMRFADSVTIDFHKMGWGHYPASAFIVARREDLKFLFRSKEKVPYFAEADYHHDPALFTLECSRPALGPYSVMASLDGIGLAGYQMLVSHAITLASAAKEKIDRLDYCKVLNSKCFGPTVVWWVLPKGRNAKKIYNDIVKGKLTKEECGQYFQEIKHLFDKRISAMNPEIDARLSYTMSMGYFPNGIQIPAWKAVFFNPRTDMKVIDQIIRSIEEL